MNQGGAGSFCDAMLSIHHEIQQVINGSWPKDDNTVNAPHSLDDVLDEQWSHPTAATAPPAPCPIYTNTRFGRVLTALIMYMGIATWCARALG